jgi:DNA recombination protein Rad52
MDPPGGFSPEQASQLSQPLTRDHVKTRKQGGKTVSYVEGWHAIAEANRIFGFGAWDRHTLEVACVYCAERPIGSSAKPGWGVTYTARVRITVLAPGGDRITREGCGAGHGIDVDQGQAHESAIKEAETDAMKRALMTFGNPFGLALYDKEQKEVVEPPSPLLVDALARCRRDGLTDLGIAALALRLSDGRSEDLAGAPAEVLNRIISHGISTATRNECNGDSSGTLGSPVWVSDGDPEPPTPAPVRRTQNQP